MRTLVSEIQGAVGSTVSLSGWVHRIRDLGGVSFVLLRDRSGMGQLVFDAKPDVTLESVIQVQGVVSANEKAPGGVEVRVQDMQVISPAAADLPFPVNQDPGKTSLESILDNRMISLRTPAILSIFRVQSTILRCFADHLRSQGFTEIKTSKLIGTGTEGGTGLFAVDYFDSKVYLTQSPQIYKQTLIAAGLERVFEIGPAYRAEKHDTPRHINEFVSLDVEMAFVESEQDLMDLEAGILAAIFTGVRESNQKDLDAWKATVPDPDLCARIPRVSHDEAKEIVGKETGQEGLRDHPGGRARPVRLGQEDGRHRGCIRFRLPAQVAPLLYLPGGEQPHPLLRPAFPRPGGDLGQHPHQPLRHDDGEPAGIRSQSRGPEGLPFDLQVRMPPARRLCHRDGAAHAEDPGPGKRQGSDPVPAGQEADAALAELEQDFS